MVNTEEQVLFAQVISHLPVELRQHLAARQLTGRLSQARKIGPRGRALDTPMPPPDFRCVWRPDISPTALGPAREHAAVLGRNALGKPGDCFAARPALDGSGPSKSQ
jgi:hypothetical protein